MKTIKNYTIGLLFVVAVCLQSCLSVNEENFYLVTTLDAVITEEGITLKGKIDKKVFDEAGFVLLLDGIDGIRIEVEDFHGGMMEITLPFVYEYEDSRGYKRQIDFKGEVVKYRAFVVSEDWYREYGFWKELFLPADYNGHAYVDLGLSVKWATCNIGATKPEEYGDYFAWGEVEPKEEYNWDTYKWATATWDSHREDWALETLTKYCTDSRCGTVDNKIVLYKEDDAAAVNMGGSWRMPTEEEQEELIDECTWTWTDDYNGTGVAGQIVTSKTNGNSIFLPAAGSRYGSHLEAGSNGYYWSSSFYSDRSLWAYYLIFDSDNVYNFDYDRYFGRPVRGVCK